MVNKMGKEEAMKLVDVSGVTWSGRVYSSDDLKPNTKGKEVVIEDLGESNKDEESLQIMKQNEYNVVEQLKKTPAKILIVSLILSSEAHHQALRKILDKAYVRHDITSEKVISIMNIAKSTFTISFSEEIIDATVH